MASQPPTVLCVEDDPSTRQIITKILMRLPVTPIVTAEPIEAIELARVVQPHLLLLDLMLPGMDGWEVLDRIRADSPERDLRVMVLTAKASGPERLVATNMAQVDLFMAKPFDPLALGRDVLRLLNLSADDDVWLPRKAERS